MKEKAFLTVLEEMLEADSGTLNFDQRIASLEKWDSLAVVTFLAVADAEFGARVSVSDLRDCETIADLAKLIE